MLLNCFLMTPVKEAGKGSVVPGIIPNQIQSSCPVRWQKLIVSSSSRLGQVLVWDAHTAKHASWPCRGLSPTQMKRNNKYSDKDDTQQSMKRRAPVWREETNPWHQDVTSEWCTSWWIYRWRKGDPSHRRDMGRESEALSLLFQRQRADF